MKKSRFVELFTDNTVLCLLGLALFLLHMFTNHRYGFHQDEMVVVDNAYHLAWGYVEYPPLTPFLARLSISLFGLTLVSARMFSALAQCVAMVLAGLMARELGGKRMAQVVAALVAAISPIAMAWGAAVTYVTFDFLWTVLLAYLVIRLLRSEDPRLWLGIGAVIGLGMMTKYTMAFFTVGIVGAVLLTDARRSLKSPWLWGGMAVSVLIFLPNLLWQVQHDFISLDFLANIHKRDVEIGRTSSYLIDQLTSCANPFFIPMWISGLGYYLFKEAGRRFRAVGWMYVIPFLLYLVTQGRGYYMACAYPMLIAAGAVAWEGGLLSASADKARSMLRSVWGGIAAGTLLSGALTLPIAPINSAWWDVVAKINDSFTEQIGWDEMVKRVGEVYAGLPAEDQARTGILTGENDEAAALNIYGREYGLPQAISPSDTFWLRGYGNPPPEMVIIVGFERQYVNYLFEDCTVVGTTRNSYGVENDLADPPDIYFCRKARLPWDIIWNRTKHYS